MDPAPDQPAEHTCPDCGGQLSPADPAIPSLLRCTRCGRETFVVDESEEAIVAGIDPAGTPDDELDGLRIRQLATARRAAYRARSYAVIAGFVCAVATGDLLYHAGRHWYTSSISAWTASYLLFAILCAVGTVIAFRRAMEFHREATAPAQLEPPLPPDFETLNDGSRQWQKLEKVE